MITFFHVKESYGQYHLYKIYSRFSEEENKGVNEKLIAGIRNTDSKTPLIEIAGKFIRYK